MTTEMTSFVVLFRTGQIVHFDWVCNALEEAGVPFQRQEETSGGIRTAMPLSPSPFPGTWWNVRVPESLAREAQQIMDDLPFEKSSTPGVWSFGPTPSVKFGWQIFAGICLAYAVGMILFRLVHHS